MGKATQLGPVLFFFFFLTEVTVLGIYFLLWQTPVRCNQYRDGAFLSCCLALEETGFLSFLAGGDHTQPVSRS